METAVLVLIGVLGGALIGAAGPAIVMFLQTKQQRREMLFKFAVESAKHDQSTWVQVVKDTGRAAAIYPLSSYIYYYSKLLEHIEAGTLTPKVIKQLNEENDLIQDAIAGKQVSTGG